MELKCLPNESRILLWRNTIQLFHKYNRPNFTGPFFEAGLTNYRIEPQVLTEERGDEKNPDIIAGGPHGWLLIELTMSSHSKREKLASYLKIDTRNLSVYGLPAYPTPPDIISSRLKEINDGDICQILVRDKFVLKNEQLIGDMALRTALIKLKDQCLDKLPEIPVSLVPELEGYEIRNGLVDIVLQLFDPNSQGKTAYEMCEEGMERIFDKTGQTHKTSLKNKIQREMEELIRNHLAGYLELSKEGKYKATAKFKQHPKTRQFIANRLQEWANPKQRTLFDKYEPHVL